MKRLDIILNCTIHTYAYRHTPTHSCTRTRAHIHTHIHIHTRANTHTDTPTHIHVKHASNTVVLYTPGTFAETDPATESSL